MWTAEELSRAKFDLVSLVGFVPPQNEWHERRCILVASAGRLLKQIEAVEWLHTNDSSEEITALTRIMVEIATNAIYLQYAEDEEFTSFLRFDGQKINADLAKWSEVAGDQIASALHRESADRSAAMTGRRDRDLSWSRRKLHERASFVDGVVGTEISGKMHDNVARVAHFAIHGTFITLMRFLPEPHRSSVAQQARLQPEELAIMTLSVFRTLARQILVEDVKVAARAITALAKT